jgi:hypothetical protein
VTSTTPVARAQFINGLRDLANFLGAHFGYPVPEAADLLVFADGNSYAERRAVVDRLALLLGVTPADNLGHYSAGRDFGPVKYRLVAVSDAGGPDDTE